MIVKDNVKQVLLALLLKVTTNENQGLVEGECEVAS